VEFSSEGDVFLQLGKNVTNPMHRSVFVGDQIKTSPNNKCWGRIPIYPKTEIV
jgi:hypothetical protein